MARRKIKWDTSCFENLITQLDEKNRNVKGFVEDTLMVIGKKVGEDTKEAMKDEYLPAKGKLSQDITIESVIMNPEVEWDALTATVNVGFDYGKDGVGGILITGTPRMQPDYKLEDIFCRKKYWSEINKRISKIFYHYSRFD